jgi:pimeloyl-ACP methyl ester carboxylesterase
MKYISLLIISFAISISGCKNEKGKKEKIVAEQEEISKRLVKQFDEEFGKYVEVSKPADLEYYNAYNKTLELWKTPFHELNIQTSLGNAHIIVSGPGSSEVVVLLHGLNSSSTMWYPNIKALSQNHRVYAIDYLLEPGKSQVIGEVKDMSEIMNWYNEIFDRLKLEKFSLIGASKGGWLAVNIALQQKSRIRNMILLSPAQTFKWIPPGSEILYDITYTLSPKRKNLRNVLETMSVNVDKIKKAYINQYFLATEKSTNNKFILQMTPYSDEELKTLTMPVLLLIGDHDIINNEKSIGKAKKILPHSETVIIKNAGHFLSFDQSEIVNTKILDFLNLDSNTRNDANSSIPDK